MDNSLVKNGRPPYGIISVLMIGAFIAFLNNTLLNVALPSIMTDLQVDTATVQWLTTGFMLVNGIMIPTTAFLIEKYSIRRLFIVAMGLFTIGTIVAGTAHIFLILLLARMVQASGSAIMMPLLMNVMLISFPIEKRGQVMGIFGLILMAAPAIGPTLSGFILERFEWRMLFHLVTPIALIIFILGFILLKDKKEKVNIRLDFISLILSSIGFGSLLLGFSSAGSIGWGNPQVYLTIILGVISLVIFILRQNKMERPMLNFSVFRYPMFALASVLTMAVNMSMFSGMLLLPIYIQKIRGFSPLDSGLMLLPGAIVSALMSPINGRLFDRFGGKILAIIGLVILIISTYMFSDLTMETNYTYLMILHAVRMFGMSMIMMPVSTNGLNQLPRSLYPHGTAMNNTLNQVAAAVGTGLLITLMSNREDSYIANKFATITGTISKDVEEQILIEGMLAGINFSFFVSAIIAIVALILAFFIKRAKPADEPTSMNVENKFAEN